MLSRVTKRSWGTPISRRLPCGHNLHAPRKLMTINNQKQQIQSPRSISSSSTAKTVRQLPAAALRHGSTFQALARPQKQTRFSPTSYPIRTTQQMMISSFKKQPILNNLSHSAHKLNPLPRPSFIFHGASQWRPSRLLDHFVFGSRKSFFEGFKMDDDPEYSGDYDTDGMKKRTSVWKKASKGGKQPQEDAKSIEENIASSAKNKTQSLDIAFRYAAPRATFHKRTPEELAREKEIANAYSRGIQHEQQATLDFANRVLKFKLDAIAQLPVELQEEAWKVDESAYPEDTWWPTWSVPPDFPIRWRQIETEDSFKETVMDGKKEVLRDRSVHLGRGSAKLIK